MITAPSAGYNFAYRMDATNNTVAQQIEFKNDVILHNVEFYAFPSGTPTKTLLCGVYKYDSTKDGNLGDHVATSYEGTKLADHSIPFTFAKTYSLPAGKYVFTMFPIYYQPEHWMQAIIICLFMQTMRPPISLDCHSSLMMVDGQNTQHIDK